MDMSTSTTFKQATGWTVFKLHLASDIFLPFWVSFVNALVALLYDVSWMWVLCLLWYSMPASFVSLVCLLFIWTWIAMLHVDADTVNGFGFHPTLPLGVTSSGHRRFSAGSDDEETTEASSHEKKGDFTYNFLQIIIRTHLRLHINLKDLNGVACASSLVTANSFGCPFLLAADANCATYDFVLIWRIWMVL